MTGIFIIGILVLIFFWGPIKEVATNASGVTGATAKKLLLLDVVAYIAGLFLVKYAFPSFWEAWWTPKSFFWASNITLFICIIGASLTQKKWWGTVGAVVVIWVIYSHCGQIVHQARVAEETRRTDSVRKAIDSAEAVKVKVEGDYPSVGKGYATFDEPVRATLSPQYNDIYLSGPGKYVSLKNPSQVFCDTSLVDLNVNHNIWRRFDWEKYLIYAYNPGDTIKVTWEWHKGTKRY